MNTSLKEGDNLFSEGKGVFFIVNDHENNNVRSYVKNHSSDFELISNSLGNGEIDMYKSSNLSKDEVVIKILNPTPPPPSKNDTKPNKKITIKDD